MHTRATVLMISVTAAISLTGCYTPSGGLFSSSGGPQTYVSTETMQKTITMTDLRSNEVFFTVNIPPGKQLTFDFERGEGDDPVHRPDLLRWELLDRGTSAGKLHNAMSVPNGDSRFISVTLTRGIKYAEYGPEHAMRLDTMEDRPDWWTPQGGPVPRDERLGMYDN